MRFRISSIAACASLTTKSTPSPNSFAPSSAMPCSKQICLTHCLLLSGLRIGLFIASQWVAGLKLCAIWLPTSFVLLSLTNGWLLFLMMLSPFAVVRLALVSGDCVRWLRLSSCAVFCSMCSLKACPEQSRRGFVKVRYYGFFAPGQRLQLRQVVAWFTPSQSTQSPTPKQVESEKVATPESVLCCPHCGLPLRCTQLLPRKRRWQPP